MLYIGFATLSWIMIFHRLQYDLIWPEFIRHWSSFTGNSDLEDVFVHSKISTMSEGQYYLKQDKRASCSLYELSVCIGWDADFTAVWLKLLTFIVSLDCFLTVSITFKYKLHYVYNKKRYVSTWLCVNFCLRIQNWTEVTITSNTKKNPYAVNWCENMSVTIFFFSPRIKWEKNKTIKLKLLLVDQGNSQRRG